VKSLVMETSDHWPCSIEITSKIPKVRIFRFENAWMQHESFMQVVQQSWSGSSNQTEPEKRLTTKFNALRGNLKNWQSGFYTINNRIKEIKLVLYFLESLELLRDLSVSEWNFKNLVCNKHISLLKQQREY